ncbi:MAG: hypothetical protein ACJ8C4_08130 [Gemmataceae bacterium]
MVLEKRSGNAKRALSIALAKNTTTFVRLPNEAFALTVWYPNLPRTRAGNGKGKAAAEVAEADGERDEFEEAFGEPEGAEAEAG